MRPHIICHIVASIDGRIDCAMVDRISGDEYYTALEQLNCPSTLEGRVTMQHYYASQQPAAAIDPTPVGEPSWHVACQAPAYSIAVDTRGILRWQSGMVNDRPLICIMSEQVPRAHLDNLRAQGISWIVAGHDAIDLAQAMDVLGEQFGIQRLALLGGAHINGGFLRAGLIDEVSLLVAPGIDGRCGQPSVIDIEDDDNRLPQPLTLTHVEQLAGGTVWLRYNVN